MPKGNNTEKTNGLFFSNEFIDSLLETSDAKDEDVDFQS